MRSRGFTLSEVLAVIVIIAMLSALLWPVGTQAKQSAQGTVCLSNLYQIGASTSLYCADHDDHYPVCVNAVERRVPELRFGRDKTDDPAKFPTPVEVLMPYVKSAGPFVCSLDLGTAVGRSGFTAYPRLSKFNGGTSYFFAELFEQQTTTSWRNPANAIWACDGGLAWHSPDYREMDPDSYQITAVAYDGHAKVFKHRNAPTFHE